jgi:exodeoxyribonuclease V beta subunit
VAILVRTNVEGRRMRDALLALGVPSVQQAVDSVFASHEAAEMERLLLAIAEPGQAPLVRSALATEMLGASAAAIERLATDDVVWDERIETFHEYHHRWSTHGFVAMLRLVLAREGVVERLLAFADGERRLTNLAHVTELLHAAAVRQRGGMASLVEWLADARQGARADTATDEEHLVRLESDADLVSIVTVHKAKGLQYPIVFCPFLWDGTMRAAKGEGVVCHEPGVDGAVLDLGSPGVAARREQAEREELAERLRLLYVALTRARNRCYLVWGRLRDGGTSALAWLLHAGGVDADMATVAARYGTLGSTALLAEVHGVASRAGGAIRVESPPAVPGVRFRAQPVDAERLAPRRLARAVPHGYTIASYTALVARSDDRERLDYDQTSEGPEAEAPSVLDVHGFPRGARAGRMLHALLEAIDFTAPDRAMVGPMLRAWGIDETWEPVVVAWLARIVATPLDAAGSFRLDRVSRAQRVDELEFYYPVHGLNLGTLAAALEREGFAQGAFIEAASRIDAATVEGFLKGYVDCVAEHQGRYFVLDYKSNWLGRGRDAYAEPALVRAMAHGQYWLQYLVYTVALHRLLERRLPGYDYDTHMGGVRYLFLRGMDPSQGPCAGVYVDRPDRRVIDVLERAIGGLP